MIDFDSAPSEVICVISDIHSNKLALKAALDQVKSKRCDKLIILGDLLTYGIDVEEVSDIICNEINNGAILLLGNHDQIYLELIDGYCEIFNKLRPDLQESINYNIDKLDINKFKSLPWKNEFIYNNIYYSHANPYGNIWEYIKSDIDFQNAALKINSMNYIAGVFGHSHRSKIFSFKINSRDIFILNPGSVGQPRIKPIQSTLLRLFLHQNKLYSEIEQINYNINNHINDLINSSLSEETKILLISFFKE